MSISDVLDPYFFRAQMEKTHSGKKDMDGEVFIARQSRLFSFLNNMIKRLLPICSLNWRLDNYVSRQRKSKNRRNESIVFFN